MSCLSFALYFNSSSGHFGSFQSTLEESDEAASAILMNTFAAKVINKLTSILIPPQCHISLADAYTIICSSLNIKSICITASFSA